MASDIGRRVMIVDDDPAFVNSVVVLLDGVCDDILVVDDVDSAIVLYEAQKHKPGVVVLDYMLLSEPSVPVLERIRQDRTNGGPPYILMVTGRSHKRDDDFDPLVDEYVEKPVEGPRLKGLLEKYLNKIGV